MFTKKENATLKQRIEILDAMKRNGWNQTKTAKEFDCKYPNLKLTQPLVSAWAKNEAKWREQYKEDMTKGRAGTAKHIRQVEHPELEDSMELWVAQAMHDGVSLSGEII